MSNRRFSFEKSLDSISLWVCLENRRKTWRSFKGTCQRKEGTETPSVLPKLRKGKLMSQNYTFDFLKPHLKKGEVR